MLGWILAGLLGAAAVSVIVITISGIIDRKRIQDELKRQQDEIGKVLVEEINKCDRVVRLKDLDSESVYEINGDSISDDIYEGQYITI